MSEKSYEYYIEKGFEPKMAEYFASGRKTLTSAEALSEFRLLLEYNGNEKRILDMKDVIKEGTVFSFLLEPGNFDRVYVDDTHSVCWDIDPNVDSNEFWNNKVDICPDTCYVDSVRADNFNFD